MEKGWLSARVARSAEAAHHLRGDELKALHVALLADVVEQTGDRDLLVLDLALCSDERQPSGQRS